MKIHNYVWILGVLLLTCFGIAEAGTVTVTAPAASGTASTATYAVTATFDISPEENNITNMSFWYQVNSSAAYTFIGDNASFNLTSYSFVLDTTALVDGTQYIFNATAYTENETSVDQVLGSSQITSAVIDNTMPTTTYGSVAPANAATQASGSVTVDTNVDRSLTACTLFFGLGEQSVTARTTTLSGDSCTSTVTGLPEGSYSYYYLTQDGTNTSQSATRVIYINDGQGGSGSQQQQQQQQLTAAQQQQNAKNKKIFIVIGIAVLAYFLFRGKKK